MLDDYEESSHLDQQLVDVFQERVEIWYLLGWVNHDDLLKLCAFVEGLKFRMLFCQGQKQILELAQLQLFLGLVGLPSLTEGQRCLNGKHQSLRLLRVLLCLNENLLDFGIFSRALASFFLLEQLLAAKNMCLEDHRLICLVAAAAFQLYRLLKGIFDLLQYRVALLQVTDSLLELIVQGLTDFGL